MISVPHLRTIPHLRIHVWVKVGMRTTIQVAIEDLRQREYPKIQTYLAAPVLARARELRSLLKV